MKNPRFALTLGYDWGDILADYRTIVRCRKMARNRTGHYTASAHYTGRVYMASAVCK